MNTVELFNKRREKAKAESERRTRNEFVIRLNKLRTVKLQDYIEPKECEVIYLNLYRESKERFNSDTNVYSPYFNSMEVVWSKST